MDSKKIGALLKQLRGKRTQREVAEDLNISVAAVSMYEVGQRIPKDDIKRKFAAYYNKSVEQIFFD